MNGDFAIIAEFLDRNGPEVLGRALATPPPALAEKLTRLARGEASQEERAALCEVLQRQPEYLRSLAAQVRNLRDRPADPDAE
jgi:anti-sigma factor RsiW